MADRMLEYRALLWRKYQLPLKQYVFFLSDATPTMATRIEQENLRFAFELIRFAEVDYRLFLSSDKGDEVVFAVLGNFSSTQPAQASAQIIERLQQTSADGTELSRHLQQLRILANLRQLIPFIEQIMESITNYIKEEDDYFFKKGEKKGKQEAILRFLKAGILTTKQLSTFFEVSEEFVEELRKQLSDQ